MAWAPSPLRFFWSHVFIRQDRSGSLVGISSRYYINTFLICLFFSPLHFYCFNPPPVFLVSMIPHFPHAPSHDKNLFLINIKTCSFAHFLIRQRFLLSNVLIFSSSKDCTGSRNESWLENFQDALAIVKRGGRLHRGYNSNNASLADCISRQRSNAQ